MVRTEEDMQFLGFFGTIKESFKIVFSRKKIFTHITLTLILPLALIYLANVEISDLFSSNILNNQVHSSKRHHRISTHWALLSLFKTLYFIFFLILYLLSTAAVVYTIACICTDKQTPFKRVMSVVPKVWKRLLVTFLWSFFIVFVYNVVAIGILVLWVAFLLGYVVGIVLGVGILVLYLVGLVYISIVWQLASVVSVLEEKYGLKAMKKSRILIKGKMGVTVAMFVLFGLCFAGIEIVFEKLVVFEWSTKLAISIPIGILCLVLLMVVILFDLVVETIIYFICKSYHHESIDKSSLSHHLEEYHGSKHVQLERSTV
ncbi:hypothetical protein ACOSQ3_031864 [Xanthoceras sorbifolium]